MSERFPTSAERRGWHDRGASTPTRPLAAMGRVREVRSFVGELRETFDDLGGDVPRARELGADQALVDPERRRGVDHGLVTAGGG